MKLFTFIVAVLFCGISFGQPPSDTFRTETRGPVEIYKDKTGKTIGRSITNDSGGRTYSNNKGVTSRSFGTYDKGQRFVTNNTNPTNKSYSGRASSGYGQFNAPSNNRSSSTPSSHWGGFNAPSKGKY
jgi:hypothetical protein